MKQGLLFFIGVTLLSSSVWAQTVGPTETMVKARTGADVAWQKNEAARETASQLVRKLLARPLTVSSSVRIALLNNRNLQATFEEIGIAQADVMEAVTIPNPSADFTVQFPATAGSLNRYAWLVGQDFVQILMMPLKKRISEQALKAAELRVAAELIDLVAEVKKAYFILQADQQLLSKLKEIQETKAASLEFAQKQYQAGNITDLSLVQFQATYNEGKIEIIKEESALEQHREDFNILLGLWGRQTAWKIQDPLPAPPTENFSTRYLESLAVRQRLDLRAAHHEVTSLASSLGLTQTFRWVPILDFGFSGERDIDAALNMGPQFRIELPIFNQGQSRVARGQAKLRYAAAKFEALAVRIRSDVRKSRIELQVQSEKAAFYRNEALPTRLRIVSRTHLQYNAMQVSSYDLFLAKANELMTERDYIVSLRDYWIARADLECAVGGTLTPPKLVDTQPVSPGKISKTSSK